jgi:TonB family protein
LDNLTKDDPALKKFSERLEQAFDYFDKFHQVPPVLIAENGDYIISGAIPKRSNEKVIKPKRAPVQHRTRVIESLPSSVHQWPEFPGGSNAFMKYLDALGNDMVAFLPTGTRKSFVQVEFIVDKDGVPVNIKVLKGSADEDFDDELIKRLENMGTWQPAMLHDKPVAKKMVQTITVQSPE